MNRYKRYGLRREWLEAFLERGPKWLEDNILGSSQKDAARKYLIDTELIDNKGKPTPLFEPLSQLIYKDPDTVWQIVWVNLCMNSAIFYEYLASFNWSAIWTPDDLYRKLKHAFLYKYSESSLINAVRSITETFERSPLGKWFGQNIDHNKYSKTGTSRISIWALGYALYKFKEIENINGTTVKYLYKPGLDRGPYFWFGISESFLMKGLRSLKDRNLLGADLVADLDNIHFYPTVTPLTILKRALKEID